MERMNRAKHRLLIAVFFCCGCMSAFATASLSAAASVTDNTTQSQTARTPAAMPAVKNSYLVQQGDCLGKILRETYKLPDAVIFNPKTNRSIQQANPHIHNLDALVILLLPSQIIASAGIKDSSYPDTTNFFVAEKPFQEFPPQ